MKEKSNEELFKEFKENKDSLDGFSLDELRRLETVFDIKSKVPKQAKVTEPTSKFGVNADNKQVYDNEENGELISWAQSLGVSEYENLWENTDGDAGCEIDYSAWIPSEFYSSFILHAVAADTPLLDLVKMKVDVSAGNGDTVRFRHINARTAQAAGSCECMSCVSNSVTKTDITIARFGDYTTLCEFELWQAKDVKEEVVKSMSIGASRYVNAEIHDAITEATPIYDVDMAAIFTDTTNLSGSCCTLPDANNFYNACVELVANMTAAGYNDLKKNGCWLIHPSVAALLKYPNGTDVPFWMRGSTEVQNGELVKLLGIEVREDALGTAISTGADTVFAYLINKQRSIGLAWGRRPQFNYKYDGVCDSWKVTFNSYLGVDSIEDASIGTVSSP